MAWRLITMYLVAGILAFVAVPALSPAQSSCDVDQLSREETGQYRLAILVDQNWQFFDSNDKDTEHILHLQGDLNQQLCIAWEAPPYKGNKRQIVYASTQYRDDQPLWLFRNNVVAQLPFVGRLLWVIGVARQEHRVQTRINCSGSFTATLLRILAKRHGKASSIGMTHLLGEPTSPAMNWCQSPQRVLNCFPTVPSVFSCSPVGGPSRRGCHSPVMLHLQTRDFVLRCPTAATLMCSAQGSTGTSL